MRKTFNISIGGYPFVVEEDAYESLNKYFEAVKKCYSKEKNFESIVSDIEERVGEILVEVRGGCEVVDYIMVEMVKKRIGEPAAPAEDTQEAETVCNEENASEKFSPVKKRLYRDIDNRILGGVCSGLSAYFNIEMVWIRLVWAILFLGFPWALDGYISLGVFLLYLLCWLCIPSARTVEQKCEMKGRPVVLDDFRNYEPAPAPRSSANKPLIARILAVCLGLFLLVTGGSMVVGSAIMPFGVHLAGMEEVHIELQNLDEFSKAGEILLSSSLFWWLIGATILLLGLLFCYAGCILTFDIKRPKWHPGLILFFLWLIVLTILAIYCTNLLI